MAIGSLAESRRVGWKAPGYSGVPDRRQSPPRRCFRQSREPGYALNEIASFRGAAEGRELGIRKPTGSGRIPGSPLRVAPE
jgi:hypothetical protein